MAQQSKNTIKQWFRTGLYPTQQQFWDLFDSIVFKGEVELGDIQGLGPALQQKAQKNDVDQVKDRLYPEEQNNNQNEKQYNIKAGTLLDLIAIYTPAPVSLRIGSAPGLADIMPDTDYDGGRWSAIQLGIFAEVDTIIYISGIAQVTKIKFFKR